MAQLNFSSAARRIARSIRSGRVSGNQHRCTARSARRGASEMHSVGRRRPSVLSVPRRAMASGRSEYAAQRTPARERAEIRTPEASAETA